MYYASVAGPGGMGSAAAYRLARRGLRALGLEKYTLAHNHGSSHGRSRAIRQAYFEDPSYVSLLFSGSVQSAEEHNLPRELLDADKLWTRFAQESVGVRKLLKEEWKRTLPVPNGGAAHAYARRASAMR